MIKVTKTAQEQVKSYFNDKELQPVRIFVSSGCGGSCGQGSSCCG